VRREPGLPVPPESGLTESGLPAAAESGSPGRPVDDAPEGPGSSPGVPAGRRHSRYRTAFFLLAVFGVVAAAAWALLGSRFLVVRSIEITGTHVVPKSEVLAVAGIPPGLPLVRVNTSAVASRIDHITQIQSAEVTRDWPDRIVITVQERRAALAMKAGNEFDLIDPTGVVVRQVAKRPVGIPLFAPVGPVLGNPGVRAAANVMRDLPAAIARLVNSVTVPELDAVTLHLSTGISVDWGSSGLAAQKARELAILMRTRAGYYDVSAPGTAATSG
jgi:cell division protein FtsQ